MLPGVDLKNIDPKAQFLDLDRADFEESLYKFLEAAWRYIDPSPWKDGWHIDAIAEHLQAVVDGEIKRLIINVPPRHGKSILTSVAFPAWTWAQPVKSPTSGPGVPFLYASYNDKLSLRDSVKCRRLIESSWYQERWGHRYLLSLDQNTKHRFTNDQGGERLITSIGAGVTGEGGNIIVIDDPNAANEVSSEATTLATLEWWDTVMPTRLNDMETCAFVVIQQRLGETDLTGHILEQNVGEWTHLCLPARFESNRSFITTIGWKDPRTVEGQLLWPDRFPDDKLRILERTMGPYIAAGQLQQRPEPQGGGVIKREWWQLWEKDIFPRMDIVLGCLDTAYTTKTINDYSAMVTWGIFSGDATAQANLMWDTEGRPMYIDRTYKEGAPAAMMMHAWRDRLELHNLVKQVAEECIKYKVDILLIENKAAGISVAQEIRRLYADEKFSVILFDPKSQDKLARLYSVQHLFAEGLVWSPDRKWSDMVIDEVGRFGGKQIKHDDLVDCVSMGLRRLREMGLLVRGPERLAEIESQKVYPGHRAEALYPV
jgi:predicted phage terminase large subunit-like protein